MNDSLIRRLAAYAGVLLLMVGLTACPGSPGQDSGSSTATSGGGGTTAPPPTTTSTTLTVVVLAVDSLMPTDIDGATPNIQSLIADGTYYLESRSVFSAETIPNHVAMMTGVYPDRNGIPTNNFWDTEAAPDDPDDQDLDNPNELEAKTLFTWIDEQCRQGASPRNADYRTAATLSKTYLYEIFRGDAADPEVNDAGITNVGPDRHWEPSSHPGYIGPGSEHTPDQFTGPQALTDLQNTDFIFINLGDVDRAAHAGGSTARQAARAQTDTQVGNLINELKNSGRWATTVFILVSDHGMDFSDPTANAPDGDVVFDEQGANALANSISTQPILDSLNGAACGYEPMLAVQNGGTNSISVTNLVAAAADRQDALLAARACLLNFAGTSTAADAPPSCESVVGAICKATLLETVNGNGIQLGWYANPDLYSGSALVGNLAGDTGGIMPATIKSRHENLGELVIATLAGFKFSEPNVSGNAIPGNHGHMPTIHNTMIVSGGAPFINRGVMVTTGSDNHFTRDASQSENIDVAATVAWLLGLNIADGDFPDAGQTFPNYGDGATRAGFDGRVLSEAFTISDSPSVCGLLVDD